MRSKELPKRKQLRLDCYDYTSNGAYFITICTHNRAELFLNTKRNDVGATLCGRPNNPDKMIEKRLLEIENKFLETKIDYYCIMPNHIHFILFFESKTGDHIGSPLQDVISWFKTMVTNEYIKGVKKGLYIPFNTKLWQRGYYEHIIRNERDLFEIRKYIENNPIKWETDEYYIKQRI